MNKIKLEELVKSIVRAHQKRKTAEEEYREHENDFHFDPKYGETLTAAKDREEKLLNRLERMFE